MTRTITPSPTKRKVVRTPIIESATSQPEQMAQEDNPQQTAISSSNKLETNFQESLVDKCLLEDAVSISEIRRIHNEFSIAPNSIDEKVQQKTYFMLVLQYAKNNEWDLAVNLLNNFNLTILSEEDYYCAHFKTLEDLIIDRLEKMLLDKNKDLLLCFKILNSSLGKNIYHKFIKQAKDEAEKINRLKLVADYDGSAETVEKASKKIVIIYLNQVEAAFKTTYEKHSDLYLLLLNDYFVPALKYFNKAGAKPLLKINHLIYLANAQKVFESVGLKSGSGLHNVEGFIRAVTNDYNLSCQNIVQQQTANMRSAANKENDNPALVNKSSSEKAGLAKLNIRLVKQIKSRKELIKKFAQLNIVTLQQKIVLYWYIIHMLINDPEANQDDIFSYLELINSYPAACGEHKAMKGCQGREAQLSPLTEREDSCLARSFKLNYSANLPQESIQQTLQLMPVWDTATVNSLIRLISANEHKIKYALLLINYQVVIGDDLQRLLSLISVAVTPKNYSRHDEFKSLILKVFSNQKLLGDLLKTAKASSVAEIVMKSLEIFGTTEVQSEGQEKGQLFFNWIFAILPPEFVNNNFKNKQAKFDELSKQWEKEFESPALCKKLASQFVALDVCSSERKEYLIQTYINGKPTLEAQIKQYLTFFSTKQAQLYSINTSLSESLGIINDIKDLFCDDDYLSFCSEIENKLSSTAEGENLKLRSQIEQLKAKANICKILLTNAYFRLYKKSDKSTEVYLDGAVSFLNKIDFRQNLSDEELTIFNECLLEQVLDKLQKITERRSEIDKTKYQYVKYFAVAYQLEQLQYATTISKAELMSLAELINGIEWREISLDKIPVSMVLSIPQLKVVLDVCKEKKGKKSLSVTKFVFHFGGIPLQQPLVEQPIQKTIIAGAEELIKALFTSQPELVEKLWDSFKTSENKDLDISWYARLLEQYGPKSINYDVVFYLGMYYLGKADADEDYLGLAVQYINRVAGATESSGRLSIDKLKSFNSKDSKDKLTDPSIFISRLFSFCSKNEKADAALAELLARMVILISTKKVFDFSGSLLASFIAEITFQKQTQQTTVNADDNLEFEPVNTVFLDMIATNLLCDQENFAKIRSVKAQAGTANGLNLIDKLLKNFGSTKVINDNNKSTYLTLAILEQLELNKDQEALAHLQGSLQSYVNQKSELIEGQETQAEFLEYARCIYSSHFFDEKILRMLLITATSKKSAKEKLHVQAILETFNIRKLQLTNEELSLCFNCIISSNAITDFDFIYGNATENNLKDYLKILSNRNDSQNAQQHRNFIIAKLSAMKSEIDEMVLNAYLGRNASDNTSLEEDAIKFLAAYKQIKDFNGTPDVLQSLLKAFIIYSSNKLTAQQLTVMLFMTPLPDRNLAALINQFFSTDQADRLFLLKEAITDNLALLEKICSLAGLDSNVQMFLREKLTDQQWLMTLTKKQILPLIKVSQQNPKQLVQFYEKKLEKAFRKIASVREKLTNDAPEILFKLKSFVILLEACQKNHIDDFSKNSSEKLVSSFEEQINDLISYLSKNQGNITDLVQAWEGNSMLAEGIVAPQRTQYIKSALSEFVLSMGGDRDSLLKKLKSKQNKKAICNNLSRGSCQLFFAIQAGSISSADMTLYETMDPYREQVLDLAREIWFHPLSSEVVKGKLVGEDAAKNPIEFLRELFNKQEGMLSEVQNQKVKVKNYQKLVDDIVDIIFNDPSILKQCIGQGSGSVAVARDLEDASDYIISKSRGDLVTLCNAANYIHENVGSALLIPFVKAVIKIPRDKDKKFTWECEFLEQISKDCQEYLLEHSSNLFSEEVRNIFTVIMLRGKYDGLAQISAQDAQKLKAEIACAGKRINSIVTMLVETNKVGLNDYQFAKIIAATPEALQHLSVEKFQELFDRLLVLAENYAAQSKVKMKGSQLFVGILSELTASLQSGESNGAKAKVQQLLVSYVINALNADKEAKGQTQNAANALFRLIGNSNVSQVLTKQLQDEQELAAIDSNNNSLQTVLFVDIFLERIIQAASNVDNPVLKNAIFKHLSSFVNLNINQLLQAKLLNWFGTEEAIKIICARKALKDTASAKSLIFKLLSDKSHAEKLLIGDFSLLRAALAELNIPYKEILLIVEKLGEEHLKQQAKLLVLSASRTELDTQDLSDNEFDKYLTIASKLDNYSSNFSKVDLSQLARFLRKGQLIIRASGMLRNLLIATSEHEKVQRSILFNIINSLEDAKVLKQILFALTTSKISSDVRNEIYDYPNITAVLPLVIIKTDPTYVELIEVATVFPLAPAVKETTQQCPRIRKHSFITAAKAVFENDASDKEAIRRMLLNALQSEGIPEVFAMLNEQETPAILKEIFLEYALEFYADLAEKDRFNYCKALIDYTVFVERLSADKLAGFASIAESSCTNQIQLKKLIEVATKDNFSNKGIAKEIIQSVPKKLSAITPQQKMEEVEINALKSNIKSYAKFALKYEVSCMELFKARNVKRYGFAITEAVSVEPDHLVKLVNNLNAENNSSETNNAKNAKEILLGCDYGLARLSHTQWENMLYQAFGKFHKPQDHGNLNIIMQTATLALNNGKSKLQKQDYRQKDKSLKAFQAQAKKLKRCCGKSAKAWIFAYDILPEIFLPSGEATLNKIRDRIVNEKSVASIKKILVPFAVSNSLASVEVVVYSKPTSASMAALKHREVSLAETPGFSRDNLQAEVIAQPLGSVNKSALSSATSESHDSQENDNSRSTQKC